MVDGALVLWCFGVYGALPTIVAEQDSIVLGEVILPLSSIREGLGRAIVIGDVPAYARNRRVQVAF